MTTNHTPGPWSVGTKIKDVVFSGDRAICGPCYYRTAEENAANARLIASAPDLLAALEQLAAQDPFTCADDAPIPVRQAYAILNASIARARAAIARAKGEA